METMMPAITFNRFDAGMDLRKGKTSADANGLRDLRNAYVTTGMSIKKRPGFAKDYTLEAGTIGLVAAGGKLHTFYDTGSIAHADPSYVPHLLVPAASGTLAEILGAEMFNGFLFVLARFSTGNFAFYEDISGMVEITDANFPSGCTAIIKIASKIFAVDPANEIVAYCATGNPADWTAPNDAGFLPTGLRQTGSRSPSALGRIDNRLIVFHDDSAQVWFVDPDPVLMQFDQVIDGVGTIYPRSVGNIAGNALFLDDRGVRSVTTVAYTHNLQDSDIGSPVDKIAGVGINTFQVVTEGPSPFYVPHTVYGTFGKIDIPTLVRNAAGSDIDVRASGPVSIYHSGAGQYWCSVGNHILVYSFSRVSKISAWSKYTTPWPTDDMATLDGELYLRSGDIVYQSDRFSATDDGVTYPVRVQISYQDFKRPGQLKQVYGMDAVLSGSADISLLFDPADEALETTPITMDGDTRSGGLTPVEVAATNVGIVVTNDTAEPMELNAITLYYENLGVL